MLSTVPVRQRHMCAVCGAAYRAPITEVLFHIETKRGWVWAWSTRSLCPPCRLAELHSWGLKKMSKSRAPATS